MSDRPPGRGDVPQATGRVAQEHDASDAPAVAGRGRPAFEIDVGPGVTRPPRSRPYDRRRDDPVFRPLRIYSLDPAQPKLDGAIARVKVPYEPLMPGPVGRLFEVDAADAVRGVRYTAVDLEDPRLLMREGRDPSPSDPQFHQQMVYAVASTVYAAFKSALGRDVPWGFVPIGETWTPQEGDPGYQLRLRLIPHGMQEENAYYSRERGEVRFGYFSVDANVDARTAKGGFVFTCLSHDIVAHEVVHALLDGMRPYFLVPTRPDVLAFHEGFADLIAIFQHFAYRDVVSAALKQYGARLDRAELLAGIATQFGYTTASTHARRPLRTAIDVVAEGATPSQYDSKLEMHALGSVLVSAVFEAFTTLFRRKTERYVRLATNGTGALPQGALPADLHDVLAEQASELASQFLALCIRAIDYCPPVDLDFGDYLRAMITADSELVPDDPWAYREALVDAFGRRGIFPTDVGSLAEDSLRWRPPWRPIEIQALHFANLRFEGDPGRAARADELRRQAGALAEIAADPRYMEAFGLAVPDDDRFLRPSIESIRTARRVGPDGQVLFDLVAQIVQQGRVTSDGRDVRIYGGSTVIVGPDGVVRYLIVKNIRKPQRSRDSVEYATGDGGAFWEQKGPRELVPADEPVRRLHDSRLARAAVSSATAPAAGGGLLYFEPDASPAFIAGVLANQQRR